MLVPDGGPGYTVSTHMLNSAAQYLNDQAQSLAGVRDSFNDACDSAGKAFGSSSASSAFNYFFEAWFSGLDGQAETMGSVADATQQCAVIYDHAERSVTGYVAAMPTKAPAAPKTPGIPGLLNPPPAQA